MNYMKRTCILRQIKQGFSGDGRALSGLVKIEQYGKNLSAEVSVINFAPLTEGEYYCLISDGFGRCELLPLRGKSLFNIVSKLDVSLGFCAIVLFVKREVLPIAYGICGDRQYDFKKILLAAFPTRSEPESENTAVTLDYPAKNIEKEIEEPEKIEESTDQVQEINQTPAKTNEDYDDERMAATNYYRAEEGDEREFFNEGSNNAQTTGGAENEVGQDRENSQENGNAEDVLHPIEIEPDGYYRSVKEEIDQLFKTYPKDDTLNGVFSCSEWVRIEEPTSGKKYLVGVVYDDWKAKYICYAIPAERSEAPPEEIKDVCTFVPSSVFSDTVGFFVIFQSAASGECIKPESC